MMHFRSLLFSIVFFFQSDHISIAFKYWLDAARSCGTRSTTSHRQITADGCSNDHTVSSCFLWFARIELTNTIRPHTLLIMKNRRFAGPLPRRLRLLLILFSVNICLWIIYQSTSYLLMRHGQSIDLDEFSIEAAVAEWQKEEPACRAPPLIDPNDAMVKRFLKNVAFSCPKQNPLTVLDEETGILSFVPNNSYHCYYSFFRRKHGHDNSIEYGEVKRFDKNVVVQLTEESNLVNTTCVYHRGQKEYINTHLFVPAFHSDQPSSADKPSVLIFFLESMSQFSFYTFMRKTQQALNDLQNVQQLNYFVKPLVNSFPNTMALLTGERVTQEEDTGNEYFDTRFRYLWHDFKEAGYVTAFEEDLSIVGVFNLRNYSGFNAPPCDYYPRSYWVQMYPRRGQFQFHTSMTSSKQYCFQQNGPKIKIFLDHVRQFMIKHQKQAYFSFLFHSQMTHQNINNFQLVDPFFFDFFSSIKYLLNNTILLFAGDHGPRIDPFVPTSAGRIAERMNLVSIRIPDGVDHKYPHLRRFLNANKDSLITWYDIHKMMKSIASGEFKNIHQPSPKSGAVNPMTQLVPRSRTCRDANIDEVFCVCNHVVNVEPHGKGLRTDVASAEKAVRSLLNRTQWSLCPQTVNMTTRFSYHIPVQGEHYTPIERANITVLLSPSNLQLTVSLVRMWNKWNPQFQIVDSETTTLEQQIASLIATCEP